MTEHAELVERLKRRADAAMSTVPIDIACGNFKRAQHNTEQAELDRQAAARIEQLEAENARMREAQRRLRIEALCLCSYAERIRPYIVMSEDGDALEAKLLNAARETRTALGGDQ